MVYCCCSLLTLIFGFLHCTLFFVYVCTQYRMCVAMCAGEHGYRFILLCYHRYSTHHLWCYRVILTILTKNTKLHDEKSGALFTYRNAPLLLLLSILSQGRGGTKGIACTRCSPNIHTYIQYITIHTTHIQQYKYRTHLYIQHTYKKTNTK